MSSYPAGGRLIVEPITIDVSRIAAPDAPALDTLARLQLLALRLGTTIRISNACPLLVDLIDIAGLADVLIVVSGVDRPAGSGVDRPAGSGVEMRRKIEEREEIGVDEEVLGDDGAL